MDFLLSRLGNNVRQRLHLILGLLELAGEEPTSAFQAHLLTQCRANADALLRSASDITELGDFSRGKPSCTSFHLPRMVDGVARKMQAQASAKGLDFQWSVDPLLPLHLVFDATLIKDILCRVIDNSIQYTVQGEIRLSVTYDADSAVPQIVFELRDSGPGIPSAVQNMISSGSTVDGIAGLSLLIVRKRVTNMDGKLTIVSSTANGTVLQISVPIEQVPLAPAGITQMDEAIRSRELQLNVLVAEDSVDCYDLIRSFLKDANHRLSRAVDGTECVAMMKGGEYDLVLMDVEMPGIDGYAATRAIREWETEQRRARVPIVILSADALSRQKRIGALAGCSGYLCKPIRKFDLLRALACYVPHSKLVNSGGTHQDEP